MVYVDEMKLTLGTIMMIGQDLGIENNYDMMSEDGLDNYVDDVMDILYSETWKKEEQDAGLIYDGIMEDLQKEGRLKED